MKIVFFGTPYYVIPILEALHKTFKEKSGESVIAAVVTQPPKPVGRKQTLEYSAVDSWAHKKGIPIIFDSNELVIHKVNADIGILASYGALIPKSVMSSFTYGILVVHPSLLPEFRWGSPVPAALVTDTNPTGITIIKMDEKWDHGPIVTQSKEEVLESDTYGTLRDRLFSNSAKLLIQAIPAYISGKIKLKKQEDEKANYARMIKKEDAFIPPEYLNAILQGLPLKGQWEIPFITINKKPFTVHPTPPTIHNFIRAMDPWPAAWTIVHTSPTKSQRLKILKAHLEPTPDSQNSVIVLDEVQIEGKNPVIWNEFKRGYPNYSFY